MAGLGNKVYDIHLCLSPDSSLYLTKALCNILHPGTILHLSMAKEKQKWDGPPTVIYSQERTSL